MDQEPLATKYGKRVEYIFLLVILVGLAAVLIYGWRTHPRHTQAISKVQTTTMAVDSQEFLLYYNQFWQKFNSTAAVSADINHDSIVSQTEIEIFKNKFLSDMKLTVDPTQPIFVLNEFNTVVSPEKLTCYIKHYDPKAPNRPQILSQC